MAGSWTNLRFLRAPRSQSLESQFHQFLVLQVFLSDSEPCFLWKDEWQPIGLRGDQRGSSTGQLIGRVPFIVLSTLLKLWILRTCVYMCARLHACVCVCVRREDRRRKKAFHQNYFHLGIVRHSSLTQKEEHACSRGTNARVSILLEWKYI